MYVDAAAVEGARPKIRVSLKLLPGTGKSRKESSEKGKAEVPYPHAPRPCPTLSKDAASLTASGKEDMAATQYGGHGRALRGWRM